MISTLAKRSSKPCSPIVILPRVLACRPSTRSIGRAFLRSPFITTLHRRYCAGLFFGAHGQFSKTYSGFVAKRMGAPIGAIMVATNANDILDRAINTGEYARAAQSAATLSPAMDIQVASNFERILFEALNRDGNHVRQLFDEFAQSGRFNIPPSALEFLREHFASWAIDDAETLGTMRSTYETARHLVCPHTAVAIAAAGNEFDEDQAKLDLPLVTLATAHPAKFPETVERATGVRPELPAKCADLQRSEKFNSPPTPKR